MDETIHNRLQKKAFSLLSRRAYSRGELRRKLLKFADENIVAVVLKHLEELKLLNDDEYAYNFSLSRIGREGWGPEKIKIALVNRQVPIPAISRALDQIRAEAGNDFGLAVYLTRYCGKKGLPEDPKGIRKLIVHLRRRGYHSDSIQDALKRMLPQETKEQRKIGD